MKRSTKKSSTKAAIAATMIAVPALGITTNVRAQAGTTTETSISRQKHVWKFAESFEKWKGDLWIAGVGDGHSIYENARGELFYIESSTGDMKFVSADYFKKGDSKDNTTRKAFVLPHVLEKSSRVSSSTEKMHWKVTLLGVDQSGNVIQENNKGEKFYLNTKTGDMVFVNN